MLNINYFVGVCLKKQKQNVRKSVLTPMVTHNFTVVWF